MDVSLSLTFRSCGVTLPHLWSSSLLCWAWATAMAGGGEVESEAAAETSAASEDT